MKNNGFVLTLDSFLGLTLLFFLIISSFYYLSQISFSSWNNIDLINSARDLSIVLDKGNFFEYALLQNSSEVLLEQLIITPQQVCYAITIYSESDSVELFVIKPGCVKKFDDLIVVNRSVVVNESDEANFFLTKTEAWYK